MVPHCLTARLNDCSFRAGETIRLTLHFAGSLENFKSVTNLYFHRFEKERAQYNLSSSGAAQNVSGTVLEISRTLPEFIKPGIYCLIDISLTFKNADVGVENTIINFNEPVFFQVRGASEEPLSCSSLKKLVDEYRYQPFRTNKAETGEIAKSFSVLIFGAGRLDLDGPLYLPGYSIIPIGKGLTQLRTHELVEKFLHQHGAKLKPSPEIEKGLMDSLLSFVISYACVYAAEHDDALNFCRNHAYRLFQILCFIHGQCSRELACVTVDHETKKSLYTWTEAESPYGLQIWQTPFATANKIEAIEPKLQTDPFASMLLKTCVDALSEVNFDFAILRFWSVLELVADKRINKDKTQLIYRDGTPIKRWKPENKQVEVTTQMKEGRVYKYILDSGAFRQDGPYMEDGVQKTYIIEEDQSVPNPQSHVIIRLWDVVSATYAVRNAVAHEGHFDLERALSGDNPEERRAAELFKAGVDLCDFICTQARRAFCRECGVPMRLA